MRAWNPFRRDSEAAAPAGEVRLVPGNAQHLGSRQDQQDSFGFSDPDDAEFVRHGGLAAVLADGMGGLARGHDASTIAVRAFLAAYSAKTPEESVAAALERAVQLANGAVAAMADAQRLAGSVGTTLVAAVVRPDALEWVSVGDSALYLYRRGELRLLSSPHTYAVELDAKAGRGLLSDREAQEDPDREALTSYLGAPDIPAVDLSPSPLRLEPGDRVVLASDGLFKTLTSEEVAAELDGGAQEACESLVRKTLARGAADQDNVTVLCVEVQAPAGSR